MAMKISIVTVVLNDSNGLDKTIQSVRSLEYPYLEYIVVDGGSEDGTLDIIKKNNDVIDKWISEKDSGIYNAFNKGIGLASGEYVHILNAGDVYYSPTVFNVHEFSIDKTCICRSVIKLGVKDWVWLPRFSSEYNSVKVAHPGLLVRRELYVKTGGYSEDYRYAADNLFIIQHVDMDQALLSDDYLVVMSDGGASTHLSVRHEFEKHKVINQCNIGHLQKMLLHLKVILYMCYRFFRSLF